MSGFGAYIFDLDGTLLDTLPDLVALTNTVLGEHAMPARTRDEINSFVGAGARVLLQRAALPGMADDDIGAMLARWRELYPELGHRMTAPYPGMPETLAELKARGVKLGVLSNKFDAAVRDVAARFFPGLFDEARGECAEIPRKPDPTGLVAMMGRLGVPASATAYVGDSGSDMTTALAAGAVPIGVAWGYRSESELREAGARRIVSAAEELLEI